MIHLNFKVCNVLSTLQYKDTEKKQWSSVISIQKEEKHKQNTINLWKVDWLPIKANYTTRQVQKGGTVLNLILILYWNQGLKNGCKPQLQPQCKGFWGLCNHIAAASVAPPAAFFAILRIVTKPQIATVTQF